ncbi:hypothetical protein Vretifemale_4735 [Volvox reticuliferus]|uniref:Uncharacterized protein n=1 Tax=Volvox reticuliferus TaxID=1737510 RepID=A0A8J4C561_9CHLO|nr:hypothetical protein Vretifemale_4735 [Volvox reticuliferus]
MAFVRLLISVGAVERTAHATTNHDNVNAGIDRDGLHFGAAAAVENGLGSTVSGATGVAPTFVESSHAGNGHAALVGSARLPMFSAFPRILHHQPQSSQLSTCHLLLCGRGDMGQNAVAALVLRLLSAPHPLPRQSQQQQHPQRHQPLQNAGPFGRLGCAGAAVHTISLPAIVLRGGGGDCIEDTAAGVSSLVSEALAPTHGSHGQLQVLYLPCIDTWALEQRIQMNKNRDLGYGNAEAATYSEMQGREDGIDAAAQVDSDGADEMAATAVTAARDNGRRNPMSRARKLQQLQQQQQHWLDDAELSHSDADDGDDDDGAMQAEAMLRSRTCISPAWSVFMQQVRVASAALQRPNLSPGLCGAGGFLVLATCALPPDELPSEILEFFGTQLLQGQPQIPESAIAAAAMTGWAARSPWLGGGTKELRGQQSPPACRHTLTLLPPLSAAVEAAEAVAEAAVLPVVRRVLEGFVFQALCIAAGVVTHDSATEACMAGGKVGGDKPAARAASVGAGRTHLLEAAGSLEQVGRGGSSNMDSGVLPPITGSSALLLNATELERGRRLCQQVQIAIRCIAASMLRRGSGCHLARASVGQLSCGDGAAAPLSRAISGAADIANGENLLKGDIVGLRHCGGGSGGEASRGRATEVVSLLDVAQRAMEGRIHTLETFREEVQCAAALIRAIRTGIAARPHLPHHHHQPGLRHVRPWAGAASRLQHLEGPISGNCVGYSRAVAAASMWEDAAVAACEAASRSLQLDNPENRRLMEAGIACYMKGQYNSGGNGSVKIAAAVAGPGACRYSTEERAGLRLPLDAALAAAADGGISAFKPPGLGSLEQGLPGMAPLEQPARRPRAISTADFDCMALRDAATDSVVPGDVTMAPPSAASRDGTAVAGAVMLERLAAALVARICTQLAHRGGLRRLLREGARGGVAGERCHVEELGHSSSICAQPCAADRGHRKEDYLQGNGEGAGLVAPGRALGGWESEDDCDAVARQGEHVRQVTCQILAACVRICKNHGAGKESDARDTGNAYALWVHSVTAQAAVNGVCADMSKGEAELLAAAADQLVAAIEAAAV